MGGCLILNVNGVGGVSEGPSPNPDGGKPFGFRPLCPHPSVGYTVCQPKAKTVGNTLFSENDYFHRGGPSFLP